MLTTFVDLPTTTLIHVPDYVMQLVLAASFTLLKLLNSFYAAHVDVPAGRTLFGKAVSSLRQISVRTNDLPQRLAEVLAQLWQTSGAADHRLFNGNAGPKEADDTLQLKVRCRSSLSVVYDSIWRWRQQSQQTGRESLDRAVEHPTIPDSPDESHKPSGVPNSFNVDPAIEAMDSMAWGGGYGGNAVFDPLSWALDGNLAFQFENTDAFGQPL